MPQPRKKAAAKKTAARRSAKTTVQTDRQRSQPKDDDPTRTNESDGQDAQEQNGEVQPLLPYQPTRLELEHEGFDHQAAEDARQAELAAEREEHNRRTGDASR
jgi:hypothetical protein